MIDPTQPPGQVTIVADTLGASPNGIAFDGSRIWTANGIGSLGPGSVSIVTPGPQTPWTTVTVEAGFDLPSGILFDGSSVWVTDFNAGTLLRLDSNGTIVQTVPVGMHPEIPVFDGANIWVPNSFDSSVSVVRAATGEVIATLTGNGLNVPEWAAFDGERVMVVSVGDSVSLWRSADLTPLGSVNTGNLTSPIAACSDGINFWITLQLTNELVRF
jgi:hypothetical protein